MNESTRFPVIGGRRYEPVLRQIHDILKPDWYLEIGSQTGKSLAQIDCNYIAIDPVFNISHPVHGKQSKMLFFQQTSDEFFQSGYLKRNRIKPDLAFLDGMHLFEFLLRDFINCEKHCNKDAMIILHDCCPTNFNMTERDRSLCSSRAWTGDVWKTLLILTRLRPDLTLDVINARPTGLVCISGLDPKSRILEKSYDDLLEEHTNLRLEEFGPDKFYNAFTLQPVRKFLRQLTHAK